MSSHTINGMFKESKEKINQFAELQKKLYDINYEKISSTYHYIIDNKIIQNEYDLNYLIKIIVYGCEIRPLQIAIYAHLCTIIYKTIKTPEFENFRKNLKEHLFKNLVSYNHMLLLYELISDDFFNLQEINDMFIEIYDIHPKTKFLKNILFFFSPELYSNSKEIFTEMILESTTWDLSTTDRNHLQFIKKNILKKKRNSESSENFDFYRYCRLNGMSTQLFNAIAVDNIEFLSQNFNDTSIDPILKKSYFQRFDFLNDCPSSFVVASYFDSINCFKFLLNKFDDKFDSNCLSAAAAGGATKIFSFLIFEKNEKISDLVVSTAVKYHQHQILEIINDCMKTKLNYLNLSFDSITSLNLSCFLSSINSSDFFSQQNADKQNLLMIAAKHGIPDLVNFIIQYYPIDIHQRDDKMRSLIYYAIKSSNLAVVQLILSLYKLDDPFLTMNEFFDQNAELKEYNDEPLVDNSICQACKDSTSEIVDFLLNVTKSSVNTCSFHSLSLLHFACKGSNLDVVCFLLSKNDIDVNIKDDSEQPPLYYAIMNNSNKIVNLLLEDSRINIDCINHEQF